MYTKNSMANIWIEKIQSERGFFFPLSVGMKNNCYHEKIEPCIDVYWLLLHMDVRNGRMSNVIHHQPRSNHSYYLCMYKHTLLCCEYLRIWSSLLPLTYIIGTISHLHSHLPSSYLLQSISTVPIIIFIIHLLRIFVLIFVYQIPMCMNLYMLIGEIPNLLWFLLKLNSDPYWIIEYSQHNFITYMLDDILLGWIFVLAIFQCIIDSGSLFSNPHAIKQFSNQI